VTLNSNLYNKPVSIVFCPDPEYSPVGKNSLKKCVFC